MRPADGLGEPAATDGPTTTTAGGVEAVPPPRWERRDDRRRDDGRSPGRDDRRRGESAMDRSLRALVSTRTTQVPFDLAMRTREVAQPSAEDLADAARELVVVRRHYVPPAPLVTKKGESSGKAGSGRAEDAGPRGDGRRGGRRSGRG